MSASTHSASTPGEVGAPGRAEERPPLSRDVSFLAMLATQFLGAFNDNLFKQLVLLLCVDAMRNGDSDRQPLAQAIFAIPFVFFSGIAGWLSDRTTKRTIIVTMKFVEIVVMAAGMGAFLAGTLQPGALLNFLMVVLFLMGLHSTFFGPAKYGILPEMLRERDLPAANGLVQMTTFAAIIFGVALAGYSKDWFHGRLWAVSAICVGIAVIGTLTSFFVRRTPVAHPGLPFDRSALLISRETWRMLRSDATLMRVLLISSLFWFVGGVAMPATNEFGKIGLNLGDSRTSMAAACLGIGICAGCVSAAKISGQRVSARLVRVGAWGLVLSLAGVTLIGIAAPAPAAPAGAAAAAPEVESFVKLMIPSRPYELPLRLVMISLGFFAGIFVVPLQVFMQSRPPDDQKGRMIGAMNLINWIGIVISAAFLKFAPAALLAAGLGANAADPKTPLTAHWIFAVLAALMLPVAAFYRPPDVALGAAGGDRT